MAAKFTVQTATATHIRCGGWFIDERTGGYQITSDTVWLTCDRCEKRERMDDQRAKTAKLFV